METEQHEYAGFWGRCAAYFIDYAVLSFFIVEIYSNTATQITNSLAVHPEIAKLFSGDSSDYMIKYDATSKIMYYYMMIIGFFFNWMYFAGMESSPSKGTIGKWLMGIYVTDTEGKRISFAKATGRHFSKIISGIILCIGYIMAGFTEKKQAMHDMIAGCLVMRK